MSAQIQPAGELSCLGKDLSSPIRVAVICDFREENWPSMDLVGDMLFAQLSLDANVRPEKFCPTMQFSGLHRGRSTRFFGRFVQYPRLLRRAAAGFDLFHIVDHSYAHLVRELPPGRAIVTCHDLDTFACLLEPERQPRSAAFRAMARRILSGMQDAAFVTCDTAATRDSVLAHHLIPAERLSVVHNGVHPALSPNPDPVADTEIARRVGRKASTCKEILHVGSTIERKRIDVLLRVFAEVRKGHPDARLLRVGPPFTSPQRTLAESLGICKSIDCLEHLDTGLLAACYRRASVLVQPSEAEGFGLPVIEALACGTPVVASDIPALREIGGGAAGHCPVADIDSWTRAVLSLLAAPESEKAIGRSRALQQAARFTWTNYANHMSEIYRRVIAA